MSETGYNGKCGGKAICFTSRRKCVLPRSWPNCASQKCVHNDFILFIYFGGGLTLLYDSQERRNFALHLHNSLQEKRCISDLFPQWRRLIISFRRRECDRWINDVDHRGQEGAELWFTKCQLRSRALSGDRGDTIADTSRRNTFPSQSLSVSSGTGWTDWISRRSRGKKKKKKAGWGGSNVWSACRTPACLSYNLWDMSQ